MSQGGVQPVPEYQPPGGVIGWLTKISFTLNLMLRGKLNAVGQQTVTLTANATTTTLTDERIGAKTWIGFMPITANAATANQNLRVTSRLDGSATLTHASSANTDQSFIVVYIG